MKTNTISKFKLNDKYFQSHPAIGAQALKELIFVKSDVVGFEATAGIGKVTITDNAVEQLVSSKEIDILEGYVSE